MHVCVTAYVCVCESQADTYDNTAASYSSEAGSNYIGTEWLLFLLLFPSNENKFICPRAVSARCSLDSAAACGSGRTSLPVSVGAVRHSRTSVNLDSSQTLHCVLCLLTAGA